MDKQAEILKEHYNKVSDLYDAWYASPLNHGEDKIIADLIRPYIGKRVLDIGAGTGQFLECFSDRKFDHFVGIDVSEKMLAHAREKFPEAKFLVRDMHDLPKDESNLDTVVAMYGTFSYSDTPDLLLDEIKRVLKPGGYAILMPYTKRVKHGILIGNCSLKRGDRNLDIRFFTVNILRVIASRGFVIEGVYGVNYLGGLIDLMVRFARRIGLKIPRVGYKYLRREFFLFNFINRILGSVLSNLARHVLIIARLRE